MPVDTSIIPAIKEAIRANELGAVSPYCLAFARLGSSGASFGIFQGDTNESDSARSTLRAALAAAGHADDRVDPLMSLLCRPCPHGNPLSADQTTLVNGALAAASGRDLVDRMDDGMLQVVLGHLDSSLEAAAERRRTVAPEAQLYIALWCNMTGAPNTLNAWLRGSTEMGVPSPAGPEVSAAEIQTYLQACEFFRDHPQNFRHMQQSVQAAVPKLP